MSKIQTIKIENFKAISEFTADFKGCSAIVVAGNNKGKTSLLRGIPDRIRFIRPDVMVKDGATKGKGELSLDTGERFVWDFDAKGQDKLTYYSSDNIKQNVTKDLGNRFFPKTFDIDKFLNSSPKEQSKELQKVVGIDFTDVDARYLAAYNERTTRNQEAEKYHVKLGAMLKVDKVEPVDLTELQTKKEAERKRLNELYKSNKEGNDIKRKDWNEACEVVRNDVQKFNDAQAELTIKYNRCFDAGSILLNYGYPADIMQSFFDGIKKEMQPQKSTDGLLPKEPEYVQEMPDDATLQTIDKQILEASETNAKAKAYTEYIEYVKSTELAKDLAAEQDEKVKAIEAERNQMIASAKFPEGVSISTDGVTINGFPLDRNQLSTSLIYTTALKIGAMSLGEVKSLYFDASYLDRNSLAEIQAWAESADCQLLIERPDFDGGEIKYELIENAPVNKIKKELF